MAQGAGNDPDVVVLSLTANRQLLARQEANIELQEPLSALGATGGTDALANWMPLQPLAVLDGNTVKNFFMKEPQASRWYTGRQDLSGLV